MIKNIRLILVLILLFTFHSDVSATQYNNEDFEVTPCWTYIMRTSSNLYSDGAVDVSIQCVSSVNKVEITTTLQKRTFFWWSTVETWQTIRYSSYGTLNTYAALKSNSRYRLHTTFKVYTNNDSETHNEYSNEVTT